MGEAKGRVTVVHMKITQQLISNNVTINSVSHTHCKPTFPSPRV